ncbi:unnamed protein product [Caenorhabditis nigoni]
MTTQESHEATETDIEDMETSEKKISQIEPKLEATDPIDAPQVQFPTLPIMPDMLFDGNTAVTPPNPMVNFQMALMNRIKMDLMSLAMASPLFWNFPDLAATQNMEQQYPTPIWTPQDTVPMNQELHGATQNMEDTVVASEDNEMINDQENEVPQIPMDPISPFLKGISQAKTNFDPVPMSQLDQNELPIWNRASLTNSNDPTPNKSDCKKCSNCSITQSCRWRNVSSSRGILCQACYIYEQKYKKTRPMKAILNYKKRTIDLSSTKLNPSAMDKLSSLLASPTLATLSYTEALPTPTTKLSQGPSTPRKTPAKQFSISSLLASPTPATKLAMDPLSLFPAIQLASATSTPKRRAMDPLSLLASPTLAMDPTTPRMARCSPATQSAMEASPTPSKLAQDPTTPRNAPAIQSAMEASSTPATVAQNPTTLVAPNPSTPKRSSKRKLLEESQTCSNCSITNSCQWRNIKSKEAVLCNACYVYRRYIKKDRPTSAIESYKNRINEL